MVHIYPLLPPITMHAVVLVEQTVRLKATLESCTCQTACRRI